MSDVLSTVDRKSGARPKHPFSITRDLPPSAAAAGMTIVRDPQSQRPMQIVRDEPPGSGGGQFTGAIVRDPTPVTRGSTRLSKPPARLPANRQGFDRTTVEAAPTGWSKVARDFQEDMAPAMREVRQRNAESQANPYNPMNIVRDAGTAYDLVSGAVQGTVGRVLYPHDNNVTGYNEEHRRAIGDAAAMAIPYERIAGAAGKGAKVVSEAADAGLKRFLKPGAIVRDAKPVTAASGGRTMHAAVEEDVLHGPDQHGAGPIVGDEPTAVERVDNAMFRLGGHHTASQIEAKQALDALPPEVKDPKVQEELTHVLEQRLIDPDAPIPPHLQAAYDAYEPWATRQREAVNRLRARGDPEVEDYLADQGYVPRYAKGKSPGFDARLPGERQRQVLSGKSSLNTSSKSLKQRSFHVVTDQDGVDHFVEGRPNETDIKDRPYVKTRQATIQEIEANTDVRYHKNALVNTITRALEDEKVERNLEVLDELKAGLKDEGLAHQFEWTQAGEGGRILRGPGRASIPPGMVELPHVPQLRGWAFDPSVADAIKDYRPAPAEPIGDVLAKVNRMLTASMFATPFPHIANVGAMWTVGRGWDWMSAPAYVRGMKAGARAFQEVMTLGPKYRQMLREGSGLRAADDATRNFHELMLRAAGHDIETNPTTFRALAQAFRLGTMTPADVANLIYSTSHKVLWTVNDMLLLQRQLELEARGMSSREAIAEAEKWIANYRVPPQVFGQRWINNLLTGNHFITFGRYEFGKWQALGEMAKPFLKGDAAGAKDALGKILVLGIMMGFSYPLMDLMWQHLTGNPNARVHRGGSATMVDAAVQFSRGEKDFASAMASMLTPAPAPKAAYEILSNTNLYSRQHIVEPESSAAGKAAQAVEYGSQYFMPGEDALRSLNPGGGWQALASLAGISLPPKDPAVGRGRGKRYDREAARRRERRDPLTRALKDAAQ